MRTDFFISKISNRVVVVSPDSKINSKIKEAFSTIKKVDKAEYKKVLSRLKIVFVTRKRGNTNEFLMPHKHWFANRTLIEKSDVVWLASLLVHESFHATQFKKGKYILPLGKRIEAPAIKYQEKFLAKANKEDSHLPAKALKEKYWENYDKDNRDYTYFRNLLNLYEKKALGLKKVK